MPNYQNGKIYSLRSHQTDDVYIGSTTLSLALRKAGHVGDFKRWLNGCKNYVTSFEIIKYDDYYIELIEYFPCNSKEELHKREGEIIRETENCVNKVIAGRSQKEYCEDNKEKMKEYWKQYREDNKEKIKQYREDNKEKKKQYLEDNKEKIKEQTKQYREDNKEKIKKYHEDNKEKIKEYMKEYREDNKEIIKQYYLDNKERLKEQVKQYREDNKERLTEKFECECGGKYINRDKSAHFKTKKHKKYKSNNICV
jgi:gas vesicle protein